MLAAKSIADKLFHAFPGICCFLYAIFTPLQAVGTEIEVPIAYFGMEERPHTPLSLLDLVVEDDGIRGAELALKDNKTTGSFLGHNYSLKTIYALPESVTDDFKALLGEGFRIFVVDLPYEQLHSVANLPEAQNQTLLFNVRAPDDELRNSECRANMLHILPSRAMLADGLAQYLVWKRWDEWVLITGQTEVDKAYAEAVRRSAKRFGAKIVDEIDWQFDTGARRTDSGHVTAQQEVPSATQTGNYDIAIVADEADYFGEYLSYRTYRPRPVGGTQGMVATSWHRSHEQWGGTQLQRRFKKLAKRDMTPRDYAAWVAVRAIGEAVVKSNSADIPLIKDALFDPKFKLAAFKGVPLTFRTWNGQLRQPILVTGARSLITVSPQRQFLHERSPLDTLGYDLPDSSCDQFPQR